MRDSNDSVITLQDVNIKETYDIIDLLNKGLITTMQLNKYFQSKIVKIKVLNGLYSVRELFIYSVYTLNNINYKVFCIDEYKDHKNESISYEFDLSELSIINHKYISSNS